MPKGIERREARRGKVQEKVEAIVLVLKNKLKNIKLYIKTISLREGNKRKE